jgi:tRNA A-37 threonylcarbamoyl transferase component Bud32
MCSREASLLSITCYVLAADSSCRMTPVDFEERRVGGVFRSRKNRVFKIRMEEGMGVAKVYPEARIGAAQAEFRLLKRCSDHGVLVPTPIELASNTIVMAYVDGENVADVVDGILAREHGARARVDDRAGLLAKRLADWLASFHRAFRFELCRGDTILRNFMISDDRIYGIDFEEAHYGDALQDIGELCASILGMRPLFGPLNFKLTSYMVSGYWKAIGRNRSAELSEWIAVGLEHYAKFREDGEFLQDWAHRFRSEGPALLEKSTSES